MTQNVTAGKIFVTAFLDFATYKKFSSELAWETEVWLADMPDHMIHLNGNKFLGPRLNFVSPHYYLLQVVRRGGLICDPLAYAASPFGGYAQIESSWTSQAAKPSGLISP